MLSWIFKKRPPVGAPAAAPSPPHTEPTRAADKAQRSEVARALWLPRLQAAQGDDAALLQVAQGTTVLEVKLAAVEALASEAALKQAEREFRSHDRNVHRAAKRRLLAVVTQREARDRADALIEAARALAGEAPLPANRLVALDRDWQALDASLLDPPQRSEFAELRDRLDAALRERGDHQQRLQRWGAEATRALAGLQIACAQAASGAESDFESRRESAAALLDARPEAPAATALAGALQDALGTAMAVEARLAWLAAAESPADGSAIAAESWQDLPPLAERELARKLDERFAQWQRRHASAPAPAATAAPAPSVAPAAGQLQRLDDLLRQAEAALADGQLAAMQQLLQTIDVAMATLDGSRLADAVHARHQALHAERARLKGWQQWGGGRAREDLVAEAEALARLTLAAADPEASDAAKLHPKAHGEAIQSLRARWKELDRLGAPTGQSLWQRFDAGLQAAYQPVAAHQAALKAARQDNLLAREALLDALDAVPFQPEFANGDELAASWKERLHTLERFHLAWRQLGPLEHTAPAAARSVLQQRLRGSVERIEAPLNEARSKAAAEREQFIARAEALARELGQQPQMRDVVPRVRDLQAQWQQHARTLPLARATESALWARFRAATDAVFAQREAAFSARDAELAAHLQEREALLARLSALSDETPGAESRRTLAEVDRAWRQDVELPRGAAGALDARYREARDAAVRRLAERARMDWQTECDSLAARLALCEAREAASSVEGDLAERWAAASTLSAPWEAALAQRWALPAGAGPLSGPAFDEVLLQLEAALDLPTSAEFLAARRELKLRAMKDALEGRRTPDPTPTRPAEGFAAALRQGCPTAAQRERLRALIAALRQAPPGTLQSAGQRD